MLNRVSADIVAPVHASRKSTHVRPGRDVVLAYCECVQDNAVIPGPHAGGMEEREVGVEY
jgi:hypothetical protein